MGQKHQLTSVILRCVIILLEKKEKRNRSTPEIDRAVGRKRPLQVVFAYTHTILRISYV